MRGVDTDQRVVLAGRRAVRKRRPHRSSSSPESRASSSRKPRAEKTNHTQDTGLRGTAPETV